MNFFTISDTGRMVPSQGLGAYQCCPDCPPGHACAGLGAVGGGGDVIKLIVAVPIVLGLGAAAYLMLRPKRRR